MEFLPQSGRRWKRFDDVLHGGGEQRFAVDSPSTSLRQVVEGDRWVRKGLSMFNQAVPNSCIRDNQSNNLNSEP